jgi:cysteine desulfurase
MNPVYLDNAAATPVRPEIREFLCVMLQECYANQEAAHDLAAQLREKLRQAEFKLSDALTDAPDAPVFWGNSATEMFNLISLYPPFRRSNIVTSSLEHPALLAALARTGAEIRQLNPNPKNGIIEPEQLESALDQKTGLVVLHHVQSELGTIQNLVKLGTIIRTHAPQAKFLADTVQSAGKITIPWDAAGLDIAFCSGHKFGAPGGAAIFCRHKNILDFLKKSRSEKYLSGRPEPAQCLTMAEAAAISKTNRELAAATAAVLKQQILDNLLDFTLPGGATPHPIIPAEAASPFILHLILPEIQAAVAVRMLSQRGIHIASGSACQAESDQPSAALLAMSIKRQDAYSGIRISFWQNRSEDINLFIDEFRYVISKY